MAGEGSNNVGWHYYANNLKVGLVKPTYKLEVSFTDVFQFDQHQDTKDLMSEINKMLSSYPDKVQDTYKIVKALIE